MNARTLNKIFKALADGKRREILQMLVIAAVAMNITDISSHFTDSRQAITKHIQTLARAGLVILDKKGRDTFCKPNPATLRIVEDWLAFYRRFWTDKMDSLDSFLNRSGN